VVKALAEATLVLVLFSDASRVGLGHLRRAVRTHDYGTYRADAGRAAGLAGFSCLIASGQAVPANARPGARPAGNSLDAWEVVHV